jgi:hypothetical protein
MANFPDAASFVTGGCDETGGSRQQVIAARQNALLRFLFLKCLNSEGLTGYPSLIISCRPLATIHRTNGFVILL